MESLRSHPRRLDRAVAALVVAGLAVCIAAGVFLIDRPTAGDLPGIALGSETILVVERVAMLFATWLLMVMVLVRALAGDLPIEISGRGLRYADAGTAQQGMHDSRGAFEHMKQEMAALRDAILVMEARQHDVRADKDDML